VRNDAEFKNLIYERAALADRNTVIRRKRLSSVFMTLAVCMVLVVMSSAFLPGGFLHETAFGSDGNDETTAVVLPPEPPVPIRLSVEFFECELSIGASFNRMPIPFGSVTRICYTTDRDVIEPFLSYLQTFPFPQHSKTIKLHSNRDYGITYQHAYWVTVTYSDGSEKVYDYYAYAWYEPWDEEDPLKLVGIPWEMNELIEAIVALPSDASVPGYLPDRESHAPAYLRCSQSGGTLSLKVSEDEAIRMISDWLRAVTWITEIEAPEDPTKESYLYLTVRDLLDRSLTSSHVSIRDQNKKMVNTYGIGPDWICLNGTYFGVDEASVQELLSRLCQ